MSLPRELSGPDLARALRVGTLAGILAEVAGHSGSTRDQLAAWPFGDR